jgi:hypothetical protein
MAPIVSKGCRLKAGSLGARASKSLVCRARTRPRLIRGMQVQCADAGADIESKLSLNRQGLQRNSPAGAADQYVGAQSCRHGNFGGWTAISARKHPDITVGIGKHGPGDYAAGGKPDVEAHSRHGTGVGLFAFSGRTAEKAAYVALRPDNQANAAESEHVSCPTWSRCVCACAEPADKASEAAIAIAATELRIILSSPCRDRPLASRSNRRYLMTRV